MLYGIGCVRGGGRVIHRSARNGANGRIARDTCPSALPGNGKVRPEGYFVTSYPTGKVDVLGTSPVAPVNVAGETASGR